MRIQRLHYALQYNIHAPKNKKKDAKELIPLPGDAPKTLAAKRINELQQLALLKAFTEKR